MKKLLCIVAIVGVIFLAMPTHGQRDAGSGQMAGATPEQVVALMTAKLSLTDDQRAKITPVIADRQQKIQALKADTSERPMQRAKKAKEILAESDKKIKAVLTPDQVTQYDALEQQMKDRAQAKRNGGRSSGGWETR